MNSLLERLRRRLRELARPLDDVPSSDGSRQASRVHSGEPPERRTEIETTRRPQASDRTIRSDEASLPAQQPPPPPSTRLKAAVFSKRRQPVPQRHAGTIWESTSFLDVGMGATGDDRADRARVMLFNTEAEAAAVEGPVSDVMSWPMRPRPPTTNMVATCPDSSAQPWWTPEQALTQANALDLPAAPLCGATQLDGCPSLVQHSEVARQMAETSSFDLQASASQLQAFAWRVD